MTRTMEWPEPRFHRGDRVIVRETNIPERTGTVGAVKRDRVGRCWRAEVRLDEDGLTWSYVESLLVSA